MPYASEFVNLDKLQIHVRRVSSDGPTLVMLHGLSDSGACWTRVVDQLSPRFDIVMVDLRGHGLSDAPETGYLAADFAQDVVRVIEALGCLRVGLIGHSLGADTAVQLAITRPDLVECLALEDPPWSDDWVLGSARQRAARAAEWARDLSALQGLSLDQIRTRGRLENPQWDARELEPWAESKRQFRLRALAYIESERPAWQLLVRGLACRVLLVTGETRRGALVSEAMAEEARQLVSGLEHVKLKGAGHSVHRDRFEPYMAALTHFLGEI